MWEVVNKGTLEDVKVLGSFRINISTSITQCVESSHLNVTNYLTL